MKSKIVKLFILVGLTLCLGSPVLKGYSGYIEKQTTQSFKEKIDKKDNNKTLNPKIGDEVAIIKIPSIKLDTVVIYGMEEKDLNYYVCQFETSAMPGENGNFSLAGHSSHIYNEVFNNVHKVKVGDEIIIETIKDDFKYTVSKVFEIEPNDISVLEQNMDKKELTIVTCTDSGKNRLIIKGELTN